MGVIGGLITWYALKNDNRKLAKNCLVLGIVLDVLEIMFIAFLLVSNNLNFITELGPFMKTNDFEFHFQFESP